MFTGKKSAQIREILISESAWEEMTCLFAPSLGCAIAAGVGAGIFSSMAETGERLVRWERTHTPDPEKHELYQDSRDKWQAVYQDQLGLVDHGLTTSLWKAPGL